MTEKPLVSVIINCYNGEKYLREAIDSVIAQTYENWELVFWDNQSTDSTAEIVKSYNNEKVHYYYASEHTNLGEARNMAMREANGAFIAFLDSDDWWDPLFIDEGIRIMLHENYGVYYSNYYNVIDGNSNICNKEKISGRKSLHDILKYYKIGMSANIIRREYVTEYNIVFNPYFQIIEDYDFFIKIGQHKDFYYNSTPLAYYRIHKSSSSFTYRKGWYLELRMLYDSLKEDYMQQGKGISELRSIRNNMEHYHAEELIRDNDRIGLLKLIIKNYDLTQLWKKIICILFGCSSYNRIRGVK